MDLHSHRIIGSATNKRMTTGLICQAVGMAYNLRQQSPKGLVFHGDRGAQYTSKRYRKLLKSYGIRSNMSDVGACWEMQWLSAFLEASSTTGSSKLLNPAVSIRKPFKKVPSWTWSVQRAIPVKKGSMAANGGQ